MGRFTIGFGIIAALATLISCEPEPATQLGPPTSAAHEGFPILGGHVAASCEECHIEGAVEQGLPPEDGNGWVTALGTDCLGCHTDTSELIFPGGHKNGATCNESGCHSASDDCWRNVRGDCVVVPTPPPGEPPPPVLIGHEGDRAILFPLEGPHEGPGCGDCHTGASDDEQRGGSNDCEMCHTRPAAHFEADRDRGPDDVRDCKACHATEGADGKLQVNDAWVQGVTHDLYWPHNRIDVDNSPYAVKPEDQWAIACIDCHTTPGVQDTAGVTCNTCHVPYGTAAGTQVELSAGHANYPGQCHNCHSRGDNL